MMPPKPPVRYLPTLTEVVRPSPDRLQKSRNTATNSGDSADEVLQHVQRALEQFEANLRMTLQHEMKQTIEKVLVELQAQIDSSVAQEVERLKHSLFQGASERDAA